MKGAGFEVFVFTTILIILITFIALYASFVNQDIKTREINFEVAELNRLKNTIILTNASLRTTWFVSAVQAMFRTADESIGCGFDDNVGPADFIPENYWYRYDPRNTKSDKENAERFGTGESKYNFVKGDPNAQPRLCHPDHTHVAAYLKQAFEPYMILRDEAGVAIDVAKKVISLTANQVRIEVSEVLNDFLLNGEGIESLTSNRISGAIGTSTLDTRQHYRQQLYTALPEMATIGRGFVNFLLFGVADPMTNQMTGDEETDCTPGNSCSRYDAGTRYQDIYAADVPGASIEPTASKDAYLALQETKIRQWVESIASDAVDMDVKKAAFELRAITAEESGIQEIHAQPRTDKHDAEGLLFHYDITLSMKEKSDGVVTAPVDASFGWPTASRRITSCFGERVHPITGEVQPHSGLDIGNDGNPNIFAVLPGTVEQVITNCVVGDAECGGGYGNTVVINHGNGLKTRYAHMKEESIQNIALGKQITQEEITNGFKLGEIGETGRVTGPHLHFEVILNDEKENPCDYIDCSRTSYLTCPGTVQTVALGDFYYYHNEAQNSFTPRPVSLDVKAEDWLVALSCRERLFDEGETEFELRNRLRLFNWQKERDLACCANVLWSCNADVKELPEHQRLATGQQPELPVCGELIRGTVTCTDNGFVYVPR